MLKITVSVVPPVDTGLKEFTYCDIFACNDGTGTKEKGNYDIWVEGACTGGGWDEWYGSRRELKGISRNNYFQQARETMNRLMDFDEIKNEGNE